MTVTQVCTRPPITARPDESLVAIARLMRDAHVGDLVIVDHDDRPVGIITDRDIVVSAVAQSPDRIETLSAGDVMTPNVATIGGHAAVEQALELMARRGVRRLPVVDGAGRVEGVIALDDILEHVSTSLGTLVAGVARGQRAERERRR